MCLVSWHGSLLDDRSKFKIPRKAALSYSLSKVVLYALLIKLLVKSVISNAASWSRHLFL